MRIRTGSFAAPMWTPVINNIVVILVTGAFLAVAGLNETPGTISPAGIQLLGAGQPAATGVPGMLPNLLHGQDARDVAVYVALCANDPNCKIPPGTIKVGN